MADNWDNIGNIAQRVFNASPFVKSAYIFCLTNNDGTCEIEKDINILADLLKDTFKLDLNSRQIVAMRHQQLEFQKLSPVIPQPEEVFNEPDSGMKIIIENKPVKEEQKEQEQEQKPIPSSEPIKKTFEEIYENNIDKVCKMHKKDLETAYKIINENCNRPYTMLCKHANNCYKKQFCWFAHSKKEQDDANDAYIKTLKDYYADQSEYIEFINGFINLFGKDWEAYGLMLSCHKNGRIPYTLCKFGNKCNNSNCTYNHIIDNKSRFFENHAKIFEDIQFVKQPEEV